MKMHNIRSIEGLLSVLLIAAALFLAACTHWTGPKKFSGHRDRTLRLAKSEMDHFMGSVRYQQADVGEHYRLGRYFQQRGRHMLAVTEFSRVIHHDPRRADAYNAMGVSYDQLQQFNLAEQCYLWALVLKPDFAAAYNNLGYSYLMQGKPEKAVVQLQKAVSLQDRNARFHNNLALAYRQTGNAEKAYAEFNRSGQEVSTQSSEPQPSPLVSANLTEEVHGIENDGEDERSPSPSASSTAQDTTSLSDRIRHAVSNAIWSDENENQPARTIPDTPQAAPLWLSPQIEISNGNGVTKMASNIGSYFKYKGYDVHRLSNANHFNYPRTQIFYSDGQRQVACTLSQMLFGPDIVCDLIYNGKKRGQIKILMGKDMAGLNHLFSGRIKIQVANGNGVRDMAGKLSNYLRTKGFYVVKPANAGHFGYEFTRIYYPTGRLTNARFVAREFPERDTGRLIEDDRQSDTIYIIIGKDFTF